MLDCGFSPLMSSLSDRNMRLGDVLLPPGIKQRCLFTSLALLSSFGRETSLVKITGPRSIFISLFTSLVYFSSCYHYHYLLRYSFVNSKAGGIDNSSVLVGSKVICICVLVHVKRRDTDT